MHVFLLLLFSGPSEAAFKTEQARLGVEESQGRESQLEISALQSRAAEAGEEMRKLSSQLSRAEADVQVRLQAEHQMLKHEELEAWSARSEASASRALSLEAMEELRELHGMLECKQTSLVSQNALGLEEQLAKTEAAFKTEQARLGVEESQGRESQLEISALQSRAAEAGEEMRKLSSQLSKSEADVQVRLQAEHQMLKHEELEAWSARSEASASRALSLQAMEELRELHGMLECKQTSLAAVNQRAETAEILVESLQEVLREAEVAAVSATVAIQQSASAVECARASEQEAIAEVAEVQSELQELLAKVKANCDQGFCPGVSAKGQETEGSSSELQEAVKEIRRWRSSGGPLSKFNGSVLQRALRARVGELEQCLIDARAQQERGLCQASPGNTVAAVVLAKEAAYGAKVHAIQEELSDAHEVRAAAEALVGEMQALASRGAPEESNEAVMSFTADILDVLASCEWQRPCIGSAAAKAAAEAAAKKSAEQQRAANQAVAASGTDAHHMVWAKKMLQNENELHDRSDREFAAADADNSGSLDVKETVELVFKICLEMSLKLPKKEKIAARLQLRLFYFLVVCLVVTCCCCCGFCLKQSRSSYETYPVGLNV
ncbi:unnamed protein product [Polarella glacialis]|uniref:EF-hand domain-containing protein n=1 Tax=Polarella glacialis TaxID=89957 RepID=A0A813LJ22_POLGL|nr:unnamed protein product [Polarella glacialis]